MTLDDVLRELEAKGSEQTRKVLRRHGARDPFFGVKIQDLKPLQKRFKVNHELALALYDTGISDAMYLAGLIADDARMTKADLKRWAKQAYWYMLSDYTVPWVASGSRYGRELANEWINSRTEHIASSGWSTWSSLVAIKPDDQLDLDELRGLLDRVATTIHAQPNGVRGAMNGFVIATGSYVAPLTEAALDAARRIGVVEVDMGETSCKVPLATEYIAKVQSRGTIGKKRKTARC